MLKVPLSQNVIQLRLNSTCDKADGVIGYRVSRRNPKNNEIDKVQEVITEEFVDGDVTICDKFEYSVCALYAQ